MRKGPVIAVIGAGSTVFTRNIVGDILLHEALGDAEIRLMDIDPQRLQESTIVVEKIISTLNVSASVVATQDRRAALADANFVLVVFQIGGLAATKTDFEIPARFGYRQTIADTLGLGGIMRALRTIPCLWQVCEDMLELCPQATLLQYVNPMAMNIWAIAEKYPGIRQVGLCHSIQNTHHELAIDLGIPAENIVYRCAGINHMAFMLEFAELMQDGTRRDLYPELRERYLAGEIPIRASRQFETCPNYVRYHFMTRFGFFVTESSEHFPEYVPWYLKNDRQDIVDRFEIPVDEYIRRSVEAAESWDVQARQLLSAGTIEVERSDEYASMIVNSMWTGEPSVIYGNVPNTNLVPGLPAGCVVEVPCLVDRNGIQPTRVDDIPPQLTALMRTNVNPQEMVVRAMLDECRDHVFHSAMLDPHTAAALDLDQIVEVVDEMLGAHADLLPKWLQGRQ